MTIRSWLAAQSRRVQQTFANLTSDGRRSEQRAVKLIKLVERAGASEFEPVPGSKGARYRLPGAPKTAPTISRTEFIKRKYGAGPRQLAAERKAGTREYRSAATEAQARAQSETLRKRREQVTEPQYRQVPTNPIVYLNTAGNIASDYFSGRNLVMMHLYRDAYDHAVYTGDGTDLRRFKHMTIITYDGPGLPNYRKKGVQIYPETNLKKLLAHRNRMTARDRIKFDNDRNYRHVGSLAA